MSDIFDLDTDGRRALDAEASANLLTPEQIRTGTYVGVPKAIGMGVMRGGARAAQAVGMAGGGVLSLLERSPGDLTDPYFAALDKTVSSAVDYWTPGANEVGTAGRVLGGFSEMALPLMAGGGNPSLLIGTAEMGGALDLSKQGASNTGAVAGGVIQGLANGLGFKIPFLGSTLAKRMISGMAGNVAVDAIGGGLEKAALNLTGNEAQAGDIHPLNPESLLIDLLSGAAFGGIAHLTAPPPAVRGPGRPMESLEQIRELIKDPESRYYKGPLAEALQERHQFLTQQEKFDEEIRAMFQPSVRDAVATTANAKHFQFDTAPGDPADIESSIAHQTAMEEATNSLLEGRPIDLSGTGIHNADFIARERGVPAFTELPEELQGVDEAIREQPAQNPDRVEPPLVAAAHADEWRNAAGDIYRVESNPEGDVTLHKSVSQPDAFDGFGSSARRMSATEAAAIRLRTEANTGIEPKSTEDPIVSRARQMLAERDVHIPTGMIDQDGRMITQSARELLAQGDRDIARARHDAQGFDALVTCMLSHF